MKSSRLSFQFFLKSYEDGRPVYKANITPYTIALNRGLQWDSCASHGHTVHQKSEVIAYELSPPQSMGAEG